MRKNEPLCTFLKITSPVLHFPETETSSRRLRIFCCHADDDRCIMDGRKILVRARGTSSVKQLGTLLSEEKNAQPVYTFADGGTQNGTAVKLFICSTHLNSVCQTAYNECIH